jgi:hypothetical protein
MHKSTLCWYAGIAIIGFTFSITHAQSLAKIELIEGKASIRRSGAADWTDAKIGISLKAGDIVYTRAESFCVVQYAGGTTLRMNEETKILIEEISEKKTKTSISIGHVWVNMQKLVTSKSSFELSSPTATAAIRGTIFDMNTLKDSSTDVCVFEGKVLVGPGNAFQSKSPTNTAAKEPPHEIPGPQEIPGPYEVTLEQWRTIVNNQMISVRKDGKFSINNFEPEKKMAQDAFVKKNLVMDKAMEK